MGCICDVRWSPIDWRASPASVRAADERVVKEAARPLKRSICFVDLEDVLGRWSNGKEASRARSGRRQAAAG